MLDFIIHHRKMKYYLLVLAVLWGGTLLNSALPSDAFARQPAMASGGDGQILLEKDFGGKLSLTEKKEISRTILDSLKADIVKSLETEELFTVYAYTSDRADFITVSRHKININLLFYYEEEEDVTKLILASPIYNGDF